MFTHAHARSCTLTHAHARAHARTRTHTYVRAWRHTYTAIYGSTGAVMEEQCCHCDGFMVYGFRCTRVRACARTCGYYHATTMVSLRNSNHNEAKTLVVL